SYLCSRAPPPPALYPLSLHDALPISPLHSNFPVGDAVAGLFCAFSIASEMVRLRSDPSAKGVEVDLAATEALFRLLDCLPVEHRSEEHTSELQSRENLVCRLLLEKKK